MTRLSIAAGALAALLALTACGSSSYSGGSGRSAPMPSTSHTSSGATSAGGGANSATNAAKLIIKNFQYSGKLTVKAGEKVSVVNDDSTPHTVTATGGKLFDSGSIDGGGTGSFTAPSKPGKYPFGCTFHPNMSGMLVVTA